RGPLERRVERGQLQQDEPTELLLGVGVWPVLNLPLATPHAHGGRPRVGPLERAAPHVDARVDERAMIRSPRPPALVALGLATLVKLRLGLVDEDHVLHGLTPGEATATATAAVASAYTLRRSS